MTPREFYRLMEYGRIKSTIRMPLTSIKIGKADIMAAKLLLWLENELPEDATQGDLGDVLDAAKWWATFWGSAHTANSNH